MSARSEGDEGEPVEYTIGHVEEALARDPRVSEQGLRVTLHPAGRGGGRPGGRRGGVQVVVIAGTVATAGHKAAIADVVRSVVRGAQVHDETTVADYPEPSPSQAEELR